MEATPLFSKDKELEEKHSSTLKSNDIDIVGYTNEELEQIYKESQESYKDVPQDYLDWDCPEFIGLFSKEKDYGVRWTTFKENYDTTKANARYKISRNVIGDKARVDITVLLNPNERRLSEIIDQLPYGLIDKKITGIGATYLELHCERNSIIVTPTRALALNKLEDEMLYVGTKDRTQSTTSKAEIKEYLDNQNIEYKKILVVADSIDKVIQAITENGEDVYHDYFLLIDEIDTLQSDNHYRPILSRVIDYYFRFKQQRRALLSATVREFTHPALQTEPLTTFTTQIPLIRDANVIYTNNINGSLIEKIGDVIHNNPTDKILIAYNSVVNILQIIRMLPIELQNNYTCSILCSEASREEAGVYLSTLIPENKTLPCRINFMTCSYFSGVDINDSYHLITVSNSEKIYAALPINKIIQIYGRCRISNGILSDTILYNNSKKPLKDLGSYRDVLKKKAENVIKLLQAANDLKERDTDLEDIFKRIHRAIIERATERFFNIQSFELVRENIDEKLEISYFNIDALYEKMEAFSKYYSDKRGLFDSLKEIYPTITFEDKSNAADGDSASVEVRNELKDEVNQRLLNRLANIKDELISLSHSNALDDEVLEIRINNAKRKDEEFYKRVLAYYKYFDIEFLSNVLISISLKNKKSYRNLQNALAFRALNENHPFKSQVCHAFQKNRKYSSTEIADILRVIIRDQLFRRYTDSMTCGRLMNLFNCCIDSTYTGGKYLVKGYKPKFDNIEIPEPKQEISNDEFAIDYFDLGGRYMNRTDTLSIFK